MAAAGGTTTPDFSPGAIGIIAAVLAAVQLPQDCLQGLLGDVGLDIATDVLVRFTITNNHLCLVHQTIIGNCDQSDLCYTAAAAPYNCSTR